MNQRVEPASQISGTLSLPPDKSISHRSAMFAALHEGVSEISNFSAAADPQSTLSCLENLGVSIQKNGSNIIIEGVGRTGFSKPADPLDCGNSGTTMRLLSGIVGGAGVHCTLLGDESLSARTMKRIIDPLQEMGIEIKARKNDFAPLQIRRRGTLKPLLYPLPIPSAQLKSCVLLAGLFGDSPTRVIEDVRSRDHTERLLSLPIKKTGKKRVIESHSNIDIPVQQYNIPNDFSAAAFWLVAGSIHPNASISMPATGINKSRTAAMKILNDMGAPISIQNKRHAGPEPVADLFVKSGKLEGIEIGDEIVPNCIDEIPILAIAMLFAKGRSKITGAEELRHKETDRLAALAEMLEATGARFTVFKDGLEIEGNPDFKPKSASIKSYHDHRIAMAGAILSLMGQTESEILNANCTAISYPTFWEDLQMLTK